LLQYYNKVQEEGIKYIRNFFDTDKCPICGAYNCYKFLAFYPRPVIDEKGTFFKNFLIARFECSQKGSDVIVKHRTFSLLPYQLIPYCKYSIPFIIDIFEKGHIDDKSFMQIQEHLSKNDDPNLYIDLSLSTIYKLKKIIIETINKLQESALYPEFNKTMLGVNTDKKRITVFITFALKFECCKLSHEIRGPCALGYDYFLTKGSYIKNSHFLFGTPSQFRN